MLIFVAGKRTLTCVHGSVKQKIVKNSCQTIGAFKDDISCLAPKGFTQRSTNRVFCKNWVYVHSYKFVLKSVSNEMLK